MSKPRVTVLMPVFNAGRYLRQAVDSVLAQDGVEFELLAINDGSFDDSSDILRQAANHDRRVRLIERENRGLVATLNEGLELAEAEYIARMDADDVMLPGRLAKQVAYLDEHEKVVCVGGGYQLIDEADRFLMNVTPRQRDEALQELALSGVTPICHPTAMFRRTVTLEVGGYDPEMMLAEDLDLWLRMGERGELANLLEPVVQYRMHSASVSESAGEAQRERLREAAASGCRRRGVERPFKVAEHWRPVNTRASRHEFALKYGWWAFNSGERATAMHYGWRSLMLRPTDPAGWRLLLCAMFKPAERRTA